MIAIKHRYSDTTLCEFDVETIKQAVEKGKSNLSEANLYGTNLRGANLREANLYGTNLSGANLRGANLRGTNLYGANLRGADLRGTNLYGADLYGADLYGADLYGTNLREANLYGTNLSGANLRGTNLYGTNLYGAVIDGETVSKSPIHIPCGLRYVALITEGYMRLGCQRFTHGQWAEFSDDEISEMDTHALEFWKQWKESLLTMCKAHRGDGELK